MIVELAWHRHLRAWTAEVPCPGATSLIGAGRTPWAALAAALARLGPLRREWHSGPMQGHTTIGILPVKDKVIIERRATPDRIGSIYVPEVAKEDLKIGTVVAVGPGQPYPGGIVAPPPAQVGDVVLYTGDWQGHDLATPEIEAGGKTYRTLDADQVAAIVPPGAEVEVERYVR